MNIYNILFHDDNCVEIETLGIECSEIYKGQKAILKRHNH